MQKALGDLAILNASSDFKVQGQNVNKSDDISIRKPGSMCSVTKKEKKKLNVRFV